MLLSARFFRHTYVICVIYTMIGGCHRRTKHHCLLPSYAVDMMQLHRFGDSFGPITTDSLMMVCSDASSGHLCDSTDAMYIAPRQSIC
jgi:hypothetical protein